MRRLAIWVSGLLLLLVALDRGGDVLAQRGIATQLKATAGLSSAPVVDVRGVPFLTQAVGGRYDRVDITATDVPTGRIPLHLLHVTLHGVQVPLGKAVRGTVDYVPVSGLTADALLSYADLEKAAGRGLQLLQAGDQLYVKGTLDVLGSRQRVTGLGVVSVKDRRLVITVTRYLLNNAPVDADVARVLAGRLNVSYDLGKLPYGLTATGAGVRADGLLLTGESGPTVLQH